MCTEKIFNLSSHPSENDHDWEWRGEMNKIGIITGVISISHQIDQLFFLCFWVSFDSWGPPVLIPVVLLWFVVASRSPSFYPVTFITLPNWFNYHFTEIIHHQGEQQFLVVTYFGNKLIWYNAAHL